MKLRYYDMYDSVYCNINKFATVSTKDELVHIISTAYDSLVYSGTFVLDASDSAIDTENVNEVLLLFFDFVSSKNSVLTYVKKSNGIESE